MEPSPVGDGHGAVCDCARHTPKRAHAAKPGVWSSFLPLLACAVCPACLATYTKLLSLVGVSVGLDEAAHQLLMAVALIVSVGVSAWRSWRTGRAWPLLVATCGSTLVAAGHLLGDIHAVEWAGVLVLLIGGLSEHFRLRRQAAVAPLLHGS
jgi:hypothetical protein